MKRFYYIRSSEKRLVRITDEKKRWAKSQKFEEDVKFGGGPAGDDDPDHRAEDKFYNTMGALPKETKDTGSREVTEGKIAAEAAGALSPET